jgi:hypothetical protein
MGWYESLLERLFSADAGGLLERIPVLVGFKHLVLLGSEAIVVEEFFSIHLRWQADSLLSIAKA